MRRWESEVGGWGDEVGGGAVGGGEVRWEVGR